MEDNRDYIHFNELEKLTPLTKEQVLDAVGRGEYHFHAKIDLPEAGAVDSHNVLLYSLHVQGLIALTQQQSLQVMAGRCQLTRFKASDTLVYSNCRLVNEAFPDAVKGQFGGVHQQRVSLDNMAFIVPTLTALLPEPDSLMQLAKDKTNQGQASSFMGLLTAFTETLNDSTKQLSTLPISLQASDIRLHLPSLSQWYNRDIKPLPNQAKPVLNRLSNQSPQGLKPNIETNPVKMIQQRILTLYPKAKSREVWNLIRKDVRTETYQFDVDVIVDGIDNERLYTSKDNLDGMSFKRFQNLLSEVRSGIRE